MTSRHVRSGVALGVLALILATGCSKAAKKPVATPADMTDARRRAVEDSLRAAEAARRAAAVTPTQPAETRTVRELNFEDIHFAYDSARLTDGALGILERTASDLAANQSVRVVIEGHCDERGTNEYNLALGERRADVVRQYFNRYGIRGERLEIVSYGEERPLAAGHDENSWSRNRRAHLAPQ